MKRLRLIDAGIARGEAAVGVAVLLAMILLASLQALLRNLTNFDVAFANDALAHLGWIDPVLQKGTLWLAFIGASLATFSDKHIAIDVLHRVVPERVRKVLELLVALAASIVSFFLGRVFYAAVLNNLLERPIDYEVLGPDGPMHICEASAEAIAEASLTRPGVFCAVRSMLASLGTPVEAPEVALQLIVPVMFMMMAMRFLLKAVFRGLELAEVETGAPKVEPPKPEAP